MANTINVVVGRRKNIQVSVNATADILNTSRNPVVLKNTPTINYGFTNGQSIQVNNFVITGAFQANGSNGQPHYFLKTNGNSVYWSYGNDFPTGDYGDLTQTYDSFGVHIFDYSFDCSMEGPLFTVDLGQVL